MSERKVLTKYYPPDFDPSKIERQRKPKGEKQGLKQQTVRLMAPFSMKCTSCGEYIYKGRKFNARKEVTEEKYYAITIFRFYIRCTRCSSEITFKTDPKHMDYTCERGAKRNFEPWREAKLAEETEEEMLDRLEREEADRDKMQELEKKTIDAKKEMEIADALDQVRMRNAQRERADKEGALYSVAEDISKEREEIERELEDQARMAFQSGTGERIRRIEEEEVEQAGEVISNGTTFARQRKPKQDIRKSLGIGIKKKELTNGHAIQDTGSTTAPVLTAPVLTAPVSTVAKPLLVGYDSDDDDDEGSDD